MNNNRHRFNYIVILLFTLIVLVIAKNSADYSGQQAIQTISVIDPHVTLSNISNWSYWLNYDGESAHNPYSGNGGAVYPRGTAGAIYYDGLVWGAQVKGEVRVGGQAYRVGTQPLLNHIYRIRKDWAELTSSQVRRDAAEFNNVALADVTEQMTKDIMDQYKNDWKNWPVAEGAPFEDMNENGVYDPILDTNGMPDQTKGDYPGIHGADQVVWFKVNDQDADKTYNLYGSDPLGIELQVTVWAYNQPESRLGQSIFKKYEIKNISADTFNEMYLSQFSDPDLGDYSDDLAGCVKETNSAFVYNGGSSDHVYDNLGVAPPAVGYTLLQGPIIPSPGDTAYFDSGWLPDYKNLSMTSFAYFAAGSSISDPLLGNYGGTLQWYNLMRGYTPTEDLDNPTPYTHGSGPQKGEATKFPLDGDPVLSIGDVDGQGNNMPPGDRRIVLTSGPFTLEPGASQEMVVAVVGGHSTDYLYSINELQDNITSVHDLSNSGFDSNFLKTPRVSYRTNHSVNTSTELLIEADLTDFDNVNSCTMTFHPQNGSDTPFTIPLYDDGLHNDQAAGDNIWGNSVTMLNKKYPFAGDLSMHLPSGDKFYANQLTDVSLRPKPSLENWHIIWENRKQDGILNNGETAHMLFDIHNNDDINGMDDISVQSDEIFDFQEGIAAGGTLDNNAHFFILEAPDYGDSVSIGFYIRYDHYSVFETKTFPIVQWNQHINPVEVTHEGSSDATLSLSLVDPDSLTGDDYKIYFEQQHFYLDSDGQWKETKGADFVDVSLAKTGDMSPSVITDAVVYSESPGTITLDEVGYEFKTVYVYNMLDMTKKKLVLEDQTVIDGVDILTGKVAGDPIADGLLITIKGSYDSPKSFSDVLLVEQSGAVSSIADFNGSAKGIGDYSIYGWAEDARSISTRGFGSVDPTELGYDYECRWTGVYKSTPTVINGMNVWEVESGGSLASLYGARYDDIANHPLNPNPGSSDAFLVRIPFEVWNLDTHEQVNISIYDRKQKYDGSMDIYAFNPNDRMYTDFVNTPYDTAHAIPADGGSAADHFTWNLVWWGGNDFTTGDIIKVSYISPLTENDVFLFTAPVEVGIHGRKKISAYHLSQNYPNPFNPETTIRYQLSESNHVKLTIYNILGQKVRKLIDKKQAAGVYHIKFNGRELASGLYFYKLQAGTFVKVKKMLLIK